MRIAGVLILISTLLFSCSDHHYLSEIENINTADAIKFMFKNSAEKIAKEGLKAKLEYLSRDIESFWVISDSGAPEDLTDYVNDWDKKYKISKYELSDIHVHSLCKERAAFYYTISMTYSDSSGKSIKLIQKESGVVMKFDKEWEYLNGHTSDFRRDSL